MKQVKSRSILLLGLLLSLSACFGPETPQEVADAFWKAVINQDSGNVIKYSTLHDTKAYDSFSRDWAGYQAEWGRVVIDGEQASIESEFINSEKNDNDARKFVTYLVMQEGAWKVDYRRTADDIAGGALGNLLGALGKLGERLSQELSRSAQDLNRELDRLQSQLREKSESFRQKAQENIRQHAEELRRRVDELAGSIERALKEQDDKLNERDRRNMDSILVDLNKSREELDQPDMKVIADSNRRIGNAQNQLDALDENIFGNYKQRWHETTEDFESELNKLINSMSELEKARD